MKKLLILITVAFALMGCVAVPAYDSGYYGGYYYPDYGYYGSYYSPYYGAYPYGFVGSDVNVFFSGGSRGGHEFRGGHDSRSGHEFRSGHGSRSGGYGSHGGGRGSHGGRR